MKRAALLPLLWLTAALGVPPALPSAAAAAERETEEPTPRGRSSAPTIAEAATSEATAAEAGTESATVADDPGADAECGRDRRCRIERLRRRNRDRRLYEGLKRDDRIARLQELLAERVLPTRLRSPWQVAVRLTRLGVVAGWTPLPHLQVELGFSSITGYGGYQAAQGTTGGSQFDATVVDAVAVGLLSTGAVSPYASVGASYLWGRADSWTTRWETGEHTQSDARIVVHALRFAVGLDALLFDQGHIRVGFVYQPDLYHQARVAPGVYDPALRSGLADWLEDEVRFHPEIRIGYAFDL